MHAHISPYGLSNLATINLEIYKHHEIEKATKNFLSTSVIGLGCFLFDFRSNTDLLREPSTNTHDWEDSERDQKPDLGEGSDFTDKSTYC